MTTTKRLVSVRVDPEIWRKVRLRAVSAGLTTASVVEGALELWLRMDDANDAKSARTDAARTSETRCATCGERWAFHQSGASQNLAVKTNCRTFREG